MIAMPSRKLWAMNRHLTRHNSTEVWPLTAIMDHDNDAEAGAIMNELVSWCVQNCEDKTWYWDGITCFSFKFFFLHPSDATMFKLRFGIYDNRIGD